MVKKPTLLKRGKAKQSAKTEHITNETVAEHRERILAGGRKFKYPVQYARHRLVLNTLLISFVALVVLVGVAWWQLYPAQNTGGFIYRITQLIPLPVASVDGEPASYRDYLMEYRSSIHWLQRKMRNFNLTSSDGQRQSEHLKRQSLDRAIENSYARKIAKDKNISVSDKQVDAFIDKTLADRSRKLSRQAYEAVLSDSYGVSPDEYKLIVKEALLRQEVAFKVDDEADKKIKDAKLMAESGVPFEDVVAQYSDGPLAKVSKGDVGFVPKSNKDQGLVQAALKLKPGAVSDIIKSADAYYLVKLTEVKGDEVRYSRIKVTLHEFNNQLSKLKKDGKVKEYISVKKGA